MSQKERHVPKSKNKKTPLGHKNHSNTNNGKARGEIIYSKGDAPSQDCGGERKHCRKMLKWV